MCHMSLLLLFGSISYNHIPFLLMCMICLFSPIAIASSDQYLHCDQLSCQGSAYSYIYNIYSGQYEQHEYLNPLRVHDIFVDDYFNCYILSEIFTADNDPYYNMLCLNCNGDSLNIFQVPDTFFGDSYHRPVFLLNNNDVFLSISSIHTVAMSNNGTIVSTYDNGYPGDVKSVIELDDGYYIIGNTDRMTESYDQSNERYVSLDIPSMSVYVLRVDTEFNILWKYTYTPPRHQHPDVVRQPGLWNHYSAIVTDDNLLVGLSIDDLPRDMTQMVIYGRTNLILALDDAGVLQWRKVLEPATGFSSRGTIGMLSAIDNHNIAVIEGRSDIRRENRIRATTGDGGSSTSSSCTIIDQTGSIVSEFWYDAASPGMYISSLARMVYSNGRQYFVNSHASRYRSGSPGIDVFSSYGAFVETIHHDVDTFDGYTTAEVLIDSSGKSVGFILVGTIGEVVSYENEYGTAELYVNPMLFVTRTDEYGHVPN